VTDVFVAANTLANTSVEQLATAFTTKAGNALKLVGKDVEEGAAVLALFADQGIKGEQAGTLLSNTLFGLSDRARNSAADFERLGVEVFDADGNMKNMADIADDLTNAFDGLSTEQKLAELANMGFNKQARTGLLTLLDNGDALREYETALRDAGGAVDEVAGKQLETLSAQFELLKSSVADVGISIGAALAPTLMNLMETIKPIIENAAPLLVAFFEELAPVIGDLIGILPTLLEGLTPLIPALGDLFIAGAGLVAEILPVLVELFNDLLPIFLELVPIVVEFLKEAIVPLVPIIGDLAKKLIPLIEKIFPILVKLIEALLPPMLILLEKLFIPLIPIIVDIIDAFLPLLEKVLPVLIFLIENFLIPVLTFVAEVMSGLMIKAIEFLTGGFDDFSRFMDGFADGFKAVWDGISGFFKGLVNGMIGMFEGFVNFIIDGLNLMIRALNKISFDVPDWVPLIGGSKFGFKLPTIGRVNIPRLADGGIVMPRPGGILANIGEGGQPEAVIPLDRMRDFGGKREVNYNITVNAGIGTDGSRVGELIVNEILRFERSSGKVFARA
jgi:phage-related protein